MFQVGCAVQREDMAGLPVAHTSHSRAAQPVSPGWKSHRLSVALETRAFAMGAVFQVTKDRSVRRWRR